MKWVVDGKLRKVDRSGLGGLGKKKRSFASENGAPVAKNRREAVRRLGVLEMEQ